MQSDDQISDRWTEIEAGHFWHLRIAARECGGAKDTIHYGASYETLLSDETSGVSWFNSAAASAM
jgi:hypothetical protein